MLHNTVNIVIIGLLFAATTVAAPSTDMPRQSDISSTLHNLSTSGTGTVKATGESQICVFCHTPHGANTAVTPLWNRKINTTGTYSTYDSSSIQADIGQPGESSKLCLSCHDGTIAIGSLNVLAGQPGTVSMLDGVTFMPDGTEADTGFTRNLKQDLSNDHPISFSFETARDTTDSLLVADGELRKPKDKDALLYPGKRLAPLYPSKDNLTTEETVQCATCHDPHVSGTDDPNALGLTENNIKFLRARRFQMAEPAADAGDLVADFNIDNDIVCLECHAKPGWAASVHANPIVAEEQYLAEAAELREFPMGIKVWQAACLNCHDTHTVQGANRLLREGTDALMIGTRSTGGFISGSGKPALENTCFQCHTKQTDSILDSPIADIETEFGKARRMPLNVYNGNEEVHDIQNADFTEGDASSAGVADPNNAILGYGNPSNRHAECTDCHNPHRMSRNSLADKSTGNITTQGTHNHSGTHSNKISGVLAGTWGVEPVYAPVSSGGAKFGTASGLPTTFKVLSGFGNAEGINVTKEYQICLKCHSNYAYIDNGLPENLSSRPTLPTLSAASGGPGGTPSTGGSSDTTSLVYYTNQAMEFQAPSTHANETASLNLGLEGGAAVANDNHRSWHPVVAATGRTLAKRGGQYGTMASGNFKAPWGNAVGTQTMYCTDCHGAENGTFKDSTPGTAPWGPHGSSQDFILRGQWTRGTGQNDGGAGLCFKCHTERAYKGSGDGSSGWSGFRIGEDGRLDRTIYTNGHSGHRSTEIRRDLVCTWCHVAVPHGWKNKALLVNLNDIGPEVLCRLIDNTIYNVSIPGGGDCTVGDPMPAGTSVTSGIGGNTGYDNPPYYINARLKLTRFATGGSGTWQESDCGGIGQMQDTCDKEAAGF